MKPSMYRRVVTMNVEGKSAVQSDEQMQAYEFKSVPNYEHTLVWVNPTTPDLREEQRFDRYPDSVVPGPGGTSLHFVTFPTSSVFADPSFESEVARREALNRLRGLADHFLYVTKKKVQLIVLLNITYKCQTPNLSEERPICRRRAHHGGSRIRPPRGNIVRAPRPPREPPAHPSSQATLPTLENK